MCACALLDARDALVKQHDCIAIEAQFAPDDDSAGVMAKSRGYDFDSSTAARLTGLGQPPGSGATMPQGTSIQRRELIDDHRSKTEGSPWRLQNGSTD
jgi:hypothetical protein